jgi:predicted alpha/beta-hydrolase family hydrolase
MLRPVTIEIDQKIGRVTGRLIRPDGATVLYVLAHGAGAGMHHPFMESIANALAERRIATLRYQFPYMDAKRRSPDPPARLQATVRAAVTRASELASNLTLIAGGKSLGGRMTSMAQADAPLPGVEGLVFLGFPLHAPKRPADKRSEHLAHVTIPMLFLQGTRDDLADLSLLTPIVERLRATMHVVDDSDHSFKVRRRSGRTEAEVMQELADAIAHWVTTLA